MKSARGSGSVKNDEDGDKLFKGQKERKLNMDAQNYWEHS